MSTTLNRDSLLSFANSHREEYESLLRRFVETPTVSVDPNHLEDIRKGVELTVETIEGYGGKAEVYRAEKGNPVIHGVFGNDNKLWRITAISSSFENDPYGNGAKSRYDELVGILSEKKYGRGTSVHQFGFVYGIQQGQTAWFTNFANPDLFIQLGLLAEGQSTLRWRVIYENKVLKKAFDQDQKSREKGSL